MKTRALVKIYSGIILLGINLSYLLWINYFLKMLDSSSQWNLIDYDGPMQSALEGLYLPEEVWPCTLFCLRWAYSALSAC